MIDVVEVLQHWYACRSKSKIGVSVGADRGTVAKYVSKAVAAGIVPGGPPVSRGEWGRPGGGVVPGVGGREGPLVDVSGHQPAPTGDRADARRGDGVDRVPTLPRRARPDRWRDRVPAVCALRVPGRTEAGVGHVVAPAVPPGAEAQIDYGFLGSWLDPATDRLRRVWAFVMVLACSRHMFVRPVLALNAVSWAETHVAAFEFFGGVPARLVPDNLPTGVDRPDLYDPKINRAYAELAEHYGCLVDPARAFKPKDKARVERPMPYVRDSFWRARTWTSLPEMQSAAVEWCTSVSGRRAHRGLDGAMPGVVSETVERAALRPAGTAICANCLLRHLGAPVGLHEGLAGRSRPLENVDRNEGQVSNDTLVQQVSTLVRAQTFELCRSPRAISVHGAIVTWRVDGGVPTEPAPPVLACGARRTRCCSLCTWFGALPTHRPSE